MTLVKLREKLILLLPLSLFLFILLAIPFFIDILYSLSDVSFERLRDVNLVGLTNYTEVIRDKEFWQACYFSLRFALVTATAECAAGLFLAIYLSPLLERRSWLLAILMMPLMVAPALVGLMYRLVLHEFVGPVPHYLWTWFGNSPSFLGADNAFRTLSVIEILQWTPFALLLAYVAYQGVPENVREAARMDGANAGQTLRFIELPLMRSALIATFFIRFIDSFRVFDNIFVLTRGGAGGSTTSLSIYVYLSFFQQAEIGKAVAASMIFLLASFAFLVTLNALSGRGQQ